MGKQALVVFLILVLVQECLAARKNEGKGGKKKRPKTDKVQEAYLEIEQNPPEQYAESLTDEEYYERIDQSGKDKKKNEKYKKDDSGNSDSYVESEGYKPPAEEYREPGGEEGYQSDSYHQGGGDGYIDLGNSDGYEPEGFICGK
ncbi:uncharacterized protein LOC143803830 [Ranitomeya variabilis]|uniref:uncharacterized protein LOC143803830 n=1 Tax=Ranitomeya variabilis TaxID=490064 RepID=UPI004057B327